MAAAKIVTMDRNLHISRGGFTLAELLVASTIMSLVMLGVYTGFSTAVQSWKTGERDFALYRDTRVALSFIEGELRAIPKEADHLFAGSEHELSYVTLAPSLHADDEGQGSRLIHVRYRLERGRRNAARALIREESPVEGPLPTAIGTEESTRRSLQLGRTRSVTLVPAVEDFRIDYVWVIPTSYEGAQPPPPVYYFVEPYSRDGLPRGVRITLEANSANAGSPRKRFEEYVVFRRETSRFPAYLALQEPTERLR